MFSEVTSTDTDIWSLSRLRRRVLNPFPENGTQNKSMFQTNASGMEAGRKPDEKDLALAVVTKVSTEGEQSFNDITTSLSANGKIL